MTLIHRLAGAIFLLCLGLGVVGSADNTRGWLAKRDLAARLRALGPGTLAPLVWRDAIDASTTPADRSPWTRAPRNATIVVTDSCPSCDAALAEWLEALRPREEITVEVVYVGAGPGPAATRERRTMRTLIARDAVAFSTRTGVLSVPLLMLEGDGRHDGCVLVGRGASISNCDSVVHRPTSGSFGVPVFFGEEQSPIVTGGV